MVFYRLFVSNKAVKMIFVLKRQGVVGDQGGRDDKSVNFFYEFEILKRIAGGLFAQ